MTVPHRSRLTLQLGLAVIVAPWSVACQAPAHGAPPVLVDGRRITLGTDTMYITEIAGGRERAAGTAISTVRQLPADQLELRSALFRNIWAHRRWLYGAYMLVAVARIPARVHFQLVLPHCDTRLTLVNAGLSMTKVPHIVLFAVFSIVTLVQFDRLNPRAFGWCLLATAALGLLVELEEGATRTGNCRLTDVLPDIAGAAIAAVLVWTNVALRRRMPRPDTASE